MDLLKPFHDLIKFQSKDTLPLTHRTFEALVDAIIPQSPQLAKDLGQLQGIGALDKHIAEYLVMSLNNQLSLNLLIGNYHIYLANATAEMLNIAAREFVKQKENKKPINSELELEAGSFAALEPDDRLRVVTHLEQLKIDLSSLPLPFYRNSEFVLNIMRVITLLIIKGYYIEWSGYGSTRTEPPEQWRLEEFPISWRQVGYPGPSKGYHCLRGYLIDTFTE